jgi:predicted FMN-binding regulatory protein PaiB
MYIPEHFKEARQEEIDKLIEQQPLGALIYISPDGLDATHLPFIYNKNVGKTGTLLAHVARKNPIWREVNDGDEVLTIFHSNDAYISPNWYPSKHEHHQQVPTWDYQVVQVHGKIYVRDDKNFVHGLVAKILPNTGDPCRRVQAMENERFHKRLYRPEIGGDRWDRDTNFSHHWCPEGLRKADHPLSLQESKQ